MYYNEIMITQKTLNYRACREIYTEPITKLKFRMNSLDYSIIINANGVQYSERLKIGFSFVHFLRKDFSV